MTSVLLDYKSYNSCLKADWITLVISWWKELENNITYPDSGYNAQFSDDCAFQTSVFNQLRHVASGKKKRCL